MAPNTLYAPPGKTVLTRANYAEVLLNADDETRLMINKLIAVVNVA